MNVPLALIQMRVDPGAADENAERAIHLADEAAGRGAEVVVLPEALPFGWTDPSARDGAEAIGAGALPRGLARVARARRVYICCGVIERAGDEVFNAAVLWGPAGEPLLIHRKIYELELAHELYGLGDRLSVAATPFGRVGVMICADGFARGQVISRCLGYMGAGLILSPSSWAVPSDHDQERSPYGQLWIDNYGPVARDFGLWIAAASNVGAIRRGPWEGRKCIGCSMVVGPQGFPVLRGPYGEDAEALLELEVEIGPRPARGENWDRSPRNPPRVGPAGLA